MSGFRRRAVRGRWPIPMLVVVLVASGCGGGPRGVQFELLADQSPPIVWPTGPEPARIRYLASISAPADVGARPSFFRKLLNLLFGGTGGRSLQRPYGLAVDGEGRIFVADPDQAGVHMFDPVRGRHQFRDEVSGERLDTPVGVAVDAEGGLYVADPGRGIVFGLDSDWKERFRIADGLERPTGLAFDDTLGTLYVVDTHAHQVRVYDRDGRPVRSFGRRGINPGEFNFPTAAWVGPDGKVYISDSMNFRIQVFSPGGEYLFGFGQHGDAVGDLARPKGVATDSEGHIYVVEGLFDVVNIYDPQGRLLLSFGSAGHRAGEFWLATGLAADGRDRIYVADSFNRRVQVFQYLPAAEGP